MGLLLVTFCAIMAGASILKNSINFSVQNYRPNIPPPSQFYEDRRCRCVCPSLASLFNNSVTDRRLYTGNVPPTQCNCRGVILPLVGNQLMGRELELCPRCECRYEQRNTTVVVISLLGVLSTLIIYTGFLLCLDPLSSKKKTSNRRSEESQGEEASALLMDMDAEDPED